MQNIVKLSTAFATAGVSVAFLATAAFATSTDVVNTGNDVTVSGGSSTSTSVNVSNNNNATINQSSVNNVNTGGNDANRNIGGTSIATGNASATNAFSANANTNTTSVSNLGGGSNSSTSLTNTGDNVLLFGNNGSSTDVTVRNNNTARVNQSSVNSVNTGYNDANRNIGGTSIVTGNAGVSNVFGTQVNGNATAISGVGSNNHTNSLDVVNTGDNVTVGCQYNEVASFLFLQELPLGCGDTTNIDVTNRNNAYINQASYNTVNTGGNDANRNISGVDLLGASAGSDASIMTGTASVGNVFSAAANANVTGVNGAGLFNGTNDVTTVTNTGDDFDLLGNGTSVSTNVTVSNNNGATVYQTSVNTANTGDNDANRNIDLSGFGTGIDTGNAGLASAFLAAANWNWTMVGGNASMPGMSAWWML